MVVVVLVVVLLVVVLLVVVLVVLLVVVLLDSLLIKVVEFVKENSSPFSIIDIFICLICCLCWYVQ